MVESEIVSASGVSRERGMFERVSLRDRLALLQTFTTKPFRIGGILQGITSKTIAFMAIASHTISAAVAVSSQFSSNDLDTIAASPADSDFLIDSIDKRMEHNAIANVSSIIGSLPHANDTIDSDDNVTMTNFGNQLFTTVTSTLDAIKSNDTLGLMAQNNLTAITESDVESTTSPMIDDQNNYWALSAIILVAGTAAGNILVCLAITWERRLQNVTNYFLMSLAITDLMVAILVMPVGILTLVKGEYNKQHFSLSQ